MSSTEELVQRIESLKQDERAIIEILIERIELGRKLYGPWHVTDGRRYPAEALDEVMDALHYCAAGLLQVRGHKP
jgi:hypothetical protein